MFETRLPHEIARGSRLELSGTSERVSMSAPGMATPISPEYAGTWVFGLETRGPAAGKAALPWGRD